MKRIRNSRAARVLSWVLSVVMTTSLLLGTMSARTAYAQAAQGGATPAGNLLTVIVIDFDNHDKNKTGGDALARFATDAVAVELASSNRFEVLKRDEVTRQATELGYRPPYDQAQLSKIAGNLGANAIVTGEIAFVRADASKGGVTRGVTVGMYVRVRDTSSGELINGAAQIATALARPGESDIDTLSQDAVSKGALQSVRQILAYTLPEGTITNSVSNPSGDTVLINRGARDGVKSGMEMLVLRNGIRVGKIRTTNVYAADSEARVIENIQGVKPVDLVRATFPMPVISHQIVTQPSHRGAGTSVSTLGKVLLVVALGIVAATAVKQGGSVTGVTAEAETVNATSAVRIVWRDNLFAGNTLEYHVWRSPDAPYNFGGAPVAAQGPGTVRTYTDVPLPGTYWVAGLGHGYLHPNNPSTTTGGGGGNGTNGGNGTAAFVVPTTTPPLPPGGFVPGQSVTYQITAVIRRLVAQNNQNQNGGGGGNNGQLTEDVESAPVTSGQATPINQPILATPANGAKNVDIRHATNFSFGTRAGADQYVVEISTEPTFKNRSLIVQIGTVFLTAQSDQATQFVQAFDLTNNGLNGPLRLNATFNNFLNHVANAPAPTLFWRIGERNSGDSPGPVHWITGNPKDEDHTFRFIYSDVRSFQPAPLPPSPP